MIRLDLETYSNSLETLSHKTIKKNAFRIANLWFGSQVCFLDILLSDFGSTKLHLAFLMHLYVNIGTAALASQGVTRRCLPHILTDYSSTVYPYFDLLLQTYNNITSSMKTKRS